ncbi:MAG: NAD(P)-binding protein [Pseudomonadota bacterium]|nr:NAD(P)-binding protein [Pseudomonadota bacterium]
MVQSKIAIIGSGISGLSCAWHLSERFLIDIYERNSYFGGHSNTQTIKLKDTNIDVDTGFIVFNELNYPKLCKFFVDLGVESYPSDMSFAVSMKNGELEYSGSSLATIFAQKKNLLNINFLKMLIEIYRFYNNAEDDRSYFQNHTIDEYLKKKKYSEFFKFNHLYPMAASIWSSSLEEIMKYPYVEFVNFFSNHGLLRIINRPKWRTVLGGSKSYVEKVIGNNRINSYKNSRAIVNRLRNGRIEVNSNGKLRNYEHVVVSVHADEVKNAINHLDNNYGNIFSKIKYTKNKVYLHKDPRFMPKRKSVWASWNYIEDETRSSVTYWMNKLQNLNTNEDIFVSLNPSCSPEMRKTIKKIIYHHPFFDFKTFQAQKEIQMIQGEKNIWFCGAYLGYGFHEDGIKSGISVAKKILGRL